MKKSITLLTAILVITMSSFAQQNWSTLGNSISTGSYIGTKNNQPLLFKTNGGVSTTPQMVITAGTGTTKGYVGINTQIPTERLHVNEGNILITKKPTQANNFAGPSLIFKNGALTDNEGWKIELIPDGYPNSLTFSNIAEIWGGQNLLTLTCRNNGDNEVLGAVGIGTNLPKEKLHIRGNITLDWHPDESPAMECEPKYISFRNHDDNDFCGLMHMKESGQHEGLMLFSHLYRENGDTEPYMIQKAPALYVSTSKYNSNRDYIGLNMTHPAQRLHVAGNILISRDIMGNSNPGNANGSIMFSDYSNAQNGHYAIGYVNDGTRRGLNFWKPYDSYGNTINYVLFLSNATNTIGNVGIGTNNPTHKLTVNGKIKATEIIVRRDNIEEWPDYVFSPDYTLTSLSDLEEYVTTNKHLPGIPSQQEIKENGIELGEINAKLLEKIEQLTLYIIDQQKQIDELKSQIKNK